ncbi:MAG: outer membrane protein transport protein [Bacteroidales bacterium]|nr:outer membrane protein transport protein [Bacteroidales bacterium]
MKKIFLISALLVSFGVLLAQNEDDALRYSQNFYQGTARSMAMSGAFGALGADFSSLSTNPAGIALYRSSEFSVSPGLFTKKTESTYNGMFGEDNRSRFNLSNIGMVLTTEMPAGGSSPIKFYQIAVGMNRTNSFGNRSFIQGDNDDHSMIDVYLDRLWDVYPEDINEDNYPFDLYPAWYVYLLDTIRDNNGILYYDSPVPPGGIRQFETMNSYGSTNEWLFSAGANFNDIVFVGATLGLPYTRFYRTSVFTESDYFDEYLGFDEWNYTEVLETHGWGVNLKLGLIVWPIDWLRLGASVHTPTYYGEMKDLWYTTTDAKLGPDYNLKTSPWGEYRYELNTPLRVTGSAAVIFGQAGLISADYELVNYSKMRLRATDYSFNTENTSIRENFQTTYNLRIGTEWRLSNLNFRGGYALYGSPYADKINDGKMGSISLGIGYTENNFGLDLAWINGVINQDYYLYSSENWTTNPVAQKIISNHFVMTTRFRF